MAKVKRQIDVAGHDPRVEHDHELGVWRAVCDCRVTWPDRDDPQKAQKDRFQHENEIGAFEYVTGNEPLS